MDALDSLTNVVPQPVRTQPYLKKLGNIETLTFDNGHSVSFHDDASTSLIMTYSSLDDERTSTLRTADQFAQYLITVSTLPNRNDEMNNIGKTNG